MLELTSGDRGCDTFCGTTLRSSVDERVAYRLDQVLGAGSTAFAFRAVRHAPSGQSYAVVKLVHPDLLIDASTTAALSILKESVALGRLNEQVPPTPFVVRLLETSEVAVRYRQRDLRVPWLAMEYVHGGTLEERLRECLQTTGYAFDPGRVSRCIRALARGLRAVHAVGVLHRDIKPSNILCCGSGREELFKIADFGVARAKGLSQTFAPGAQGPQGALGTPGYAAPEQLLMEEEKLGQATDVFALGATAFFVLTGTDLFPTEDPMQLLRQAQKTRRRSIRECAQLPLELRDQVELCRQIDRVIARGTHPEAASRQQSGMDFAQELDMALGAAPSSRHAAAEPRVFRTMSGGSNPLRFATRYAPGDERGVWSAAWDGAGCCLAATTRGLEFWDGTRWVQAPCSALAQNRPRSTYYLGNGQWVVGTRAGALGVYEAGEWSELFPADTGYELLAVDGDPRDLSLLAVRRIADGQWLLRAHAGGYALAPLAVPPVRSISCLVRYSAEAWLLCGRLHSGHACAALCFPLERRMHWLDVAAPDSVYLSAAAGQGLVALGGKRGEVWTGAQEACRAEPLEWREETCTAPGVQHLGGESAITSVAVEGGAVAWAASAGSIWSQAADASAGVPPSGWQRLWHDPSWRVPIVSLFTDGTRVLGLSADGGMIEGLAPSRGR